MFMMAIINKKRGLASFRRTNSDHHKSPQPVAATNWVATTPVVLHRHSFTSVISPD
ncbi:hypothetical protein Hdeb2414_s0017g00510211 [Helianthus debilis subsp. tardiflorus]